MPRRALNGRFDEDLIYGVRMFPSTIDLYQAAAAYDLFAAVRQDIYILAWSLRLPDVDVSDDGTITSIAVATDDSTPVELLSAVAGAVANLTAEAQFTYATPFILKAGKKVQLIIAGGASDAATICTSVAMYRPIAMGGYLI
jgi:hypothetical protein